MESCLIIGKRVLLFARTSPAQFMFLPLVRMHNNVEWNQPIGLYILQWGNYSQPIRLQDTIYLKHLAVFPAQGTPYPLKWAGVLHMIMTLGVWVSLHDKALGFSCITSNFTPHFVL